MTTSFASSLPFLLHLPNRHDDSETAVFYRFHLFTFLEKFNLLSHFTMPLAFAVVYGTLIEIKINFRLVPYISPLMHLYCNICTYQLTTYHSFLYGT